MRRLAVSLAIASAFASTCSLAQLFAEEPLAPIVVDGGADAEGVYVILGRQRSPEEVAKLQAELKPSGYSPAADRFARLPRTKKILDDGGELRIVMLGDSIVNDTARSDWTFDLDEIYPDATIVKHTVVRGSTGCWWYREPGRVERYILAFDPDLIMIGGISQGDDVDAIRDVIEQIRAKSEADFLLMTGPFGTVDPTDDAQWNAIVEPGEDSYSRKLSAVADEKQAGFLDLQRLWAEHVRASGKPIRDFKRDEVHANAPGEQILGQILIRHFGPTKR